MCSLVFSLLLSLYNTDDISSTVSKTENGSFRFYSFREIAILDLVLSNTVLQNSLKEFPLLISRDRFCPDHNPHMGGKF